MVIYIHSEGLDSSPFYKCCTLPSSETPYWLLSHEGNSSFSLTYVSISLKPGQCPPVVLITKSYLLDKKKIFASYGRHYKLGSRYGWKIGLHSQT